jgi:uncharacterized oligopeptide transporter (OPT) family protein
VSPALFIGLIVYAVVFAFVFGFLVAAACGYMAGLIGSSSSPISGIGIVAVILVSVLLLVSGAVDPAGHARRRQAGHCRGAVRDGGHHCRGGHRQ